MPSSSRASQMKYVVFDFVCLLLIWKLKGVEAEAMSYNAYSYLVESFTCPAPQTKYASWYQVESFTCPAPAPQIKYDIFVNFRGADIRHDLLDSLIRAFSRKHMSSFTDESLREGDNIQTLFGIIQRSMISLVIFSPDYASSHWCLDELVKILDCRRNHGQLVIPVFYKVDPSDVRYQKGTYENAFAKHEKRYSESRVKTWRSALTRTADIKGLHSSNFRTKDELVEEIINCLLKRLNSMHEVTSTGLIRIGKPIAHLEALLRQDSKDVRVIGIWGMGGIGKTTIAAELYKRQCSKYDSCCFLANVREESGRHGILSLKEKLFSRLLGEADLKIDTPNGLPGYVKKRLGRMKVIIVLDDVSDSEQLEILVETLDWFGSGSRIIVTTRDRQVLAKRVHDIYEVGALEFDEALQLFRLIAFKQNHLEMDYYELEKTVVDYAKGNPLVLKVLGGALQIPDKEIRESQIKKLKRMPEKKVYNAMILSYDDLDREEKEIFLDIACFFDGLDLKVEWIKVLLKDSDYSVAAVLERLKDMALISISDANIVSMHDIIQEVAREIVRQESIKDPGNRSRIWDPDDIYQVLKHNQGTETIRSITFNFSRIIKDVQLSPQVFSKMSKLLFLDFYGKCQDCLHLPSGLQCLPNELRYLRWMHYPLKSLPKKFSAEKLAILDLPNSRLETLWHGVQNLVNLKVVKLSSSSHLKELPDFSKATNLEVIELRFCQRLNLVHPSVFSLNKLEILDLSWCTALTSLRSNVHLSSLRYLTLYGCLELKEFSVTSENMIELNLQYTSIKALPLSIGRLSKLENLRLANSDIKSMPTSIKNLTRLKYLDLSDCKNLQTLPKLPPSIETLDADNCISLKTVLFPSTVVEQLKENKKKVVFWNCLELDEHSLRAIGLNAQINIMKFAYQYLSTLEHHYVEDSNENIDAEATYAYPGSSVPEWFQYRTTNAYITIDISSAAASTPMLGFILCFIVPKVPSEGFKLIFIISDDEGQGTSVSVYMDRSYYEITSDHVCLLYDQRCTQFLNSRAKNQQRFRINVTAKSQSMTFQDVPVLLKGFGVHPINSSEYHFTRQIDLLGAYAQNISISFNKWDWAIRQMGHEGKKLVINFVTGLLLILGFQLIRNLDPQEEFLMRIREDAPNYLCWLFSIFM